MTQLHHAYIAWNNAATLRSRRLRFKRYTFGDQWGDIITDKDGWQCTERDIIRRCNHRPATNNIIRQLVKTIVGCWRAHCAENVENAAPCNELDEIDARTFEEFLISGCAIQRISHERRPSDTTQWIDAVDTARFFVNSITDSRGSDVELIGQLHDMSLTQIIMRYAHGDRTRAEKIKRIYDSDYMKNHSRPARALGESYNNYIDFYHADSGLCRVIEVWSLDTIERIRCHDPALGRFYYITPDELRNVKRTNKHRAKSGSPEILTRWELSAQWHCRCYAPTGELIDEHTADRHPYVFRFYPLIDGEIHSFVEDVIEQQRNLNRLLTLNDRLLATAAKGVLLFPENQASRDMSVNEAAENWASPDGVVIYRAVPGLPGPQQVMTSPGNLGISSMVEQQMRLIEEVSGVSGALRGISASSANTSASLYESEHRHSMTALADIFSSFKSFINARNRLLTPCDAS
jgi:hypothetical protein